MSAEFGTESAFETSQEAPVPPQPPEQTVSDYPVPSAPSIQGIDDIKNAVDSYMRKSAEFTGSSTTLEQLDNAGTASVPLPSIDATAQAPVLTSQFELKQTKTARIYQCILVAVIIGSLSILFSLIFHFFELSRTYSRHESYYMYLRKAAHLKHESPNESMLNACHQAIHDIDIVSAYKQRNIELESLEVDIENLRQSTSKKKGKIQKRNMKQELILLCETELEAIITIIKNEEEERKRLRLQSDSKKAFKALILQSNKESSEDAFGACAKAMQSEHVVQLYSAMLEDVDAEGGDHINVAKLKEFLNDPTHPSLDESGLSMRELATIMCSRRLEQMAQEKNKHVLRVKVDSTTDNVRATRVNETGEDGNSSAK